MDASPSPFASSSLASLRLLAGFALTAEETSPARRALLAHAGAADAGPCRALAALLSALRRRDDVGHLLDGLLAVAVGRDAQPYVGRSAEELLRCWAERGEGLEGRELTAFVWQVARGRDARLRALEAEIARACPPARLLSEPQRAVDPVLSAAAPAPAAGRPAAPYPSTLSTSR